MPQVRLISITGPAAKGAKAAGVAYHSKVQKMVEASRKEDPGPPFLHAWSALIDGAGVPGGC